MVNDSKADERSLLVFSLAIGVVFAVLGISWGLMIQSGVVLFDGIYSGFSIILSMLSIIALKLINQPDDDSFQFGRMAFEPLVVALKSIVIIAVCCYGIVTSVILIIHGGAQSTNSLLGMLYAVVSMAVCLFSWLYLKVRGRDMPDLVQAESEQWMIDTVVSGAVLASFLASYLAAGTQLSWLVPYCDPGMVVLVSVYFIRIPLARFISSIRELLMMAPDDSIHEQLETRIRAIARAHQYTDTVIRASKIGRDLAVDIAFLVHPDHSAVDIADLDRVRGEVEKSLSELGYGLWMNVVFTQDRHWA